MSCKELLLCKQDDAWVYTTCVWRYSWVMSRDRSGCARPYNVRYQKIVTHRWAGPCVGVGSGVGALLKPSIVHMLHQRGATAKKREQWAPT